MAMRFPVQCSACQSGEKFKTNAGKRLCCAVLLCCIAVQWSAVLWSAVLCCCAVECCAVLLWGVCGAYMSASLFFAHFLEKNALPSMMFAFRSLSDLPQWFHVFLLLAAVSSTFRDNKPYLRCEIGRACCLEKCLKQLREAKKHEIIVEGQRLRKANIMEGNAFFSGK